ncbi:Hypothetical predicted protein, partial [Paramuricea clavata]
MMVQDFSECKSEGRALSHEDRVFLKKVNDGILKLDDGHYEIPLPFKENDTKLPNNRRYVLKRLFKLKIKFKRSEQLRNYYTAFMKDIIDRGYAELVPAEVYRGTTVGAEYDSESLNQHLLSGPDMTNGFVDVLCRFHQEPIGVMRDIEAMFHQ